MAASSRPVRRRSSRRSRSSRASSTRRRTTCRAHVDVGRWSAPAAPAIARRSSADTRMVSSLAFVDLVRLAMPTIYPRRGVTCNEVADRCPERKMRLRMLSVPRKPRRPPLWHAYSTMRTTGLAKNRGCRGGTAPRRSVRWSRRRSSDRRFPRPARERGGSARCPRVPPRFLPPRGPWARARPTPGRSGRT